MTSSWSLKNKLGIFPEHLFIVMDRKYLSYEQPH